MKTRLFILILLCIITLTRAQHTDNQLPLDDKILTGTLPNGLTYYIRSNGEPKDRAELYLVNKIGSLQEDDDQQGLAHFAEHMAFNGTRDFPKNSLVDHLQKAGVRFGADLNAYTSFDQTVYQLPIPTDDAALFEKGFDILLNWAGLVSFDNTEIDNERGIILEEERLRGKNVSDRMSRQIYPVLMAGSRYANRLPIGKTDILKTFTYDKIKKFYRDWYRPDLQAIIAVGDFDAEQVKKLIVEKFSSLKNPSKERKLIEYSVPGNKKTLVKMVTDPEYAGNSISIYYKHPQRTITTRESYKHALIRGMINSMLHDRIQEIMTKGNAPFLYAGIQYSGFFGKKDALNISAEAKDIDSLEKAIKAAVDEATRMSVHGFTESELARAKQNTLSGIARSYNERNKLKSSYYVNQCQQLFLTGEATPGLEWEYEFYREVVPSINLKEINATAASWMTKENRIVLLEANEKDNAKLPSEALLLSWLTVDPTTVMPYVEDVVSDKLMTALPQAGTILSEKQLDAWKATELKLSNGATVILKPTDFKDNEIIFSAISRGGLSLAPTAIFRTAQYTPHIIDASGLAGFNSTQLGKLLTGKTVGITPYINYYEEGLLGSAAPADLETALQLLHLYFTVPRGDTAVLSTVREQLAVNVRNRYANP